MCRLSGNMYTICDKDLERLAAFSQLQSLNLSQCRALIDLRGLARLPQLRSLELNCCMGLKGGALKALAQLPRLRKLDLCGCSALTDDCMEHITGRHTAISGSLPEHFKIHATLHEFLIVWHGRGVGAQAGPCRGLGACMKTLCGRIYCAKVDFFF